MKSRLLGFAAVAVFATWPLALNFTHAIAGGLGDPILNMTVLAWDADSARHGFRAFWDPPFLFPHHHTLAYSEHLIGVAIFTTPVQWIARNPVVTYNVAYLGSFVLAGFGMFLLVRELFGRDDAAMLAGLAFALTPYRLSQAPHLQVLMNGWMPVGLWALHRYFATGARRWLAGFAAAFLLCGLSNGYYLYFFLLPVAVVVVTELLAPRLPRRRVLGDLLGAGAIIAVVVAPIALIYYGVQREMGFARPEDELPGMSAQLPDYFRVARDAWHWWGVLGTGANERQLFHGFVVIVFATIGAFVGRRRPAMRATIAYASIAALAVWFSMGPGPWRVYSLLFHVVPGLNGLRVPARLASVVIVALAVLAGGGFTWLLDRLPVRAGVVVAIALAAVIGVEGQHGVELYEVPGIRDKSWDRVAFSWLRDSPPGAVIELNITRLDDFHEYTTLYQLNAVAHRHPIVNGYGGWRTGLTELLGAVGSPLSEPGHVAEVLRGLRKIGVRYILLHESTYPDSAERRRIVDEIRGAPGQIAEEHEWPGVWGWRLTPPAVRPTTPEGDLPLLDSRTFAVRASQQQNRLADAFDGNLDTRWLSGDRQSGAEWIEIDLPVAADVARVRIAGAARSLIDYPRHIVVESVDSSGATTTLADESGAERLIESLASEERYPSIMIDLPANRTKTLRVRQTGRGAAWWSVHEVMVWERK